MNTTEDNKSETKSADIIETVARETEQIITKACEVAKREAEQELEKVLREYEQKTRQIVLKIREEAKSRTVEIASRLGEAIMMRIEKSSTEAVADAVAEFSKKAEQLTQTLQETAGKEAEQALIGVKAGVESEPAPAAGKQREPEEVADKTKPSFEIKVGQKLAGITGDEANGGTRQNSEEFEHWLTQ